MSFTYEEIAGTIDHALLWPTLNDDAFSEGLRLARAYAVASVCIQPHALRRCAELLAGSGVRASTTIGFPHGVHATTVKVAEARQALADGGEELDMVVNLSKVKSADWTYVRADVRAVLELVRGAAAKLKVIFENAYLNEGEKIRLCELCGELGVDWVKTSTGFGPGGATEADVALMRQHTPAAVGVKAAGGVRDLEGLLRMRALGASRVGTSATAAILEETRRRLGLPPVAAPAASGTGY